MSTYTSGKPPIPFVSLSTYGFPHPPADLSTFHSIHSNCNRRVFCAAFWPPPEIRPQTHRPTPCGPLLHYVPVLCLPSSSSLTADPPNNGTTPAKAFSRPLFPFRVPPVTFPEPLQRSSFLPLPGATVSPGVSRIFFLPSFRVLAFCLKCPSSPKCVGFWPLVPLCCSFPSSFRRFFRPHSFLLWTFGVRHSSRFFSLYVTVPPLLFCVVTKQDTRSSPLRRDIGPPSPGSVRFFQPTIEEFSRTGSPSGSQED